MSRLLLITGLPTLAGLLMICLYAQSWSLAARSMGIRGVGRRRILPGAEKDIPRF